MTQIGSNQVIKAKVPMSEVLRYAPDLTSMTSGRGSFEIAFSHYEQMPDHLVQKVAEAQKQQAGRRARVASEGQGGCGCPPTGPREPEPPAASITSS
jgi:hypothetical protein